MKSSPSQQNVVVKAWTADFLVFGQTLYHWAILPPYILFQQNNQNLASGIHKLLLFEKQICNHNQFPRQKPDDRKSVVITGNLLWKSRSQSVLAEMTASWISDCSRVAELLTLFYNRTTTLYLYVTQQGQRYRRLQSQLLNKNKKTFCEVLDA